MPQRLRAVSVTFYQFMVALALMTLPSWADTRTMPCEEFDPQLLKGSYSDFLFDGTKQEWYESIRSVKVILVGQLVEYAGRYENPALRAHNEALEEECRVYPEFWLVRTQTSWKSKAEPIQKALVYAAWSGTYYVGDDVVLFLWDRRDVPFLIGNGRPLKYAHDTLQALDEAIFSRFDYAAE